MAGLGGDAEAILSEILEYLEAKEGHDMQSALSPKPEGGPDVAALLGGEAGAPDAGKPCPVCGKSPCECGAEA